MIAKKARKKATVAIIMGSDSDLPVMKEATQVLHEFDIIYDITILSAHRTPEETSKYAKEAVACGIRVIIAGAGGAAHLAGVVASHFPLPVIGVPIKTETLNGIDSLYSTVQMPQGVPVATVGINAAKNAALLAVQILAVSDNNMIRKLKKYKMDLAKKVITKNRKLRRSE